MRTRHSKKAWPKAHRLAILQMLRKRAMLVQKAYARVWAYLRRPAHERGFINHKGPGYAPLLASARRAAKRSGGERKPLSAGQLAALHGYTGSDYVALNQALWEGLDDKKHPGLRDYAATITAGLKRLPPYRGKVNRGTTLPQAELDLMQEGQVWVSDAFLSTSTGSGFSGPHRLKIESRTGRDISWLSQHPDEQEVLFPPGTKFLVRERAQDGHTTLIRLEEVEENGK